MCVVPVIHVRMREREMLYRERERNLVDIFVKADKRTLKKKSIHHQNNISRTLSCVFFCSWRSWCVSLHCPDWRPVWPQTSMWSCSSSRGRWPRCLRPTALCPPALTRLTPPPCTAREHPRYIPSLQSSLYRLTALPHSYRCCVHFTYVQLSQVCCSFIFGFLMRVIPLTPSHFNLLQSCQLLNL